MLLQSIRVKQACEEIGLMKPCFQTKHAEIPETYINGKKYTLVFPRFIERFSQKKEIDISFTGLITPKRKKFLNKLLDTYGEVYITESFNGRDKDKKTLDSEYFERLGISKFVACPDGDFTWSYRFFEAILCQAIPIIENDSQLYKGYKFYRLGDKLEYRQDWIEHNLEKVKKEMMLH